MWDEIDPKRGGAHPTFIDGGKPIHRCQSLGV